MIPEKLRELRKSRGMTMEELAEEIGTSKQTIQRYESGRIVNIPPERILALATALSTTPSELMGWSCEGETERDRLPFTPLYDSEEPLAGRRIPLLYGVKDGELRYRVPMQGGYLTTEGHSSADFCMRVPDDAMSGARIMDGDIAFIRSQDAVDNGEIAAVLIGDVAMLKRVYYYPEEGRLILSTENARYAPLVYVREELDRVRILGKVIAFQSYLC